MNGSGNGELLTLEQLASRLEWDTPPHDGQESPRGKRLRRYLKSRSRQLGVTLLVSKGTGRGTRYHVDEATIRKHCPELFGKSLDDLHAQFKRHLLAIDQKIEARVSAEVTQQIDERVIPRLATLQKDDRRLAEQLLELSSRVASIVDH